MPVLTRANGPVSIHDHPERDDAEATDEVTEDLLLLLGVTVRQALSKRSLEVSNGHAAPAIPGRSGVPTLGYTLQHESLVTHLHRRFAGYAQRRRS